MKTFLRIAACAAVAAAIGAGHAEAATWILDYTATNGGTPTEADLTIVTADILNAVGGYDVTNISGNVDGDNVTGLINNPSQPFTSLSGDGMFLYDNVFYADQAQVLSNPGLFFTGASGHEYNLFADSADTYELYQAVPAGWYSENSVGSLTASEPVQIVGGFDQIGGGVPEPAAWALMIVGFGGAGAMLRRKRAQTAAAAAA